MSLWWRGKGGRSRSVHKRGPGPVEAAARVPSRTDQAVFDHMAPALNHSFTTRHLTDVRTGRQLDVVDVADHPAAGLVVLASIGLLDDSPSDHQDEYDRMEPGGKNLMDAFDALDVDVTDFTRSSALHP